MSTTKRLLACAFAAALPFFIAPTAQAMTFEVLTLKGEPAIFADGPIIEGDAERLGALIVENTRHSAGYFALILNSPGGDVKAAFEVAELISKHPFNAYVPARAICASACAAILFLAADEHLIVQSGMLGFHGCHNAKTKEVSQLCNHKIAETAYNNGTAYGAIMAFMETVPHDKMIWIDDKSADCWGINKYTISPEPPTYLSCVRKAYLDSIKKNNK